MNLATNHIRRRGFTLIELLVVVAIIAILMAVLLPSLAKAKEQSRTVKCASILHQYGIANQFYVQEWNGYAIPATSPNTWFSSGDNIWFANASFRSALNLPPTSSAVAGVSGKMFLYPPSMACPNAALSISKAEFGYQNMYFVYGINMTSLVNVTYPAGGSFRAIKISKVNAPQEAIQFADGIDYWVQEGPYAMGSIVCPDELTAENTINPYTSGESCKVKSISYRHQQGLNVLFMDGHVEWLRASAVGGGGNYWSRPVTRMWEYDWYEKH